MKVYIDLIFIQNFLIDFILIKETSYISKIKVNTKSVFAGALVSSSYVVLMIAFKIDQLQYLICKLLLVITTVEITFKLTNITKIIKTILIFVMVSIVNVGSVTTIKTLLNLKNTFALDILIYLIGLLASKTILNQLWEMYELKIKERGLMYDVSFKVMDTEYKYKAFLDTGNTVYSIANNLPIIFAEQKSLDETIKNIQTIKVQTVTLSCKSYKTAYVIDNIKITNGIQTWIVKAGIVFENVKLSKNGSYNMILNYRLFIENMGGIEI